MNVDPPSSVAIQEKLNLFENETCMSMFNNEPLCLQLTELQVTANELYDEIDEYVKEKEDEINNLTQALSDRPMTRQQQAAMNIQIQKLEAEVRRLEDIKANYEQNMPPLIQKTQQYINSLAGGISKKRKVAARDEPVNPSVGAQQTQSRFASISAKINRGLSELSKTLDTLTKQNAPNDVKLTAINQKRGTLERLLSANTDGLEDYEVNQLSEFIQTETTGISRQQGLL